MQPGALAVANAILFVALAVALTVLFRMDARPLADRVVQDVQPGLTRAQVRRIAGEPQRVRVLPRAECWSYTTPVRMKLCFGQRGHVAWVAKTWR